MAALFIAQMLGVDLRLTLAQQLLVVVTRVVASVGAAGIPEAGLVTMTLVFNAVGLPPDLHRPAPPGRLVPRPLPHRHQRHGRHQRQLPPRWPHPAKHRRPALPLCAARAEPRLTAFFCPKRAPFPRQMSNIPSQVRPFPRQVRPFPSQRSANQRRKSVFPPRKSPLERRKSAPERQESPLERRMSTNLRRNIAHLSQNIGPKGRLPPARSEVPLRKALALNVPLRDPGDPRYRDKPLLPATPAVGGDPNFTQEERVGSKVASGGGASCLVTRKRMRMKTTKSESPPQKTVQCRAPTRAVQLNQAPVPR